MCLWVHAIYNNEFGHSFNIFYIAVLSWKRVNSLLYTQYRRYTEAQPRSVCVCNGMSCRTLNVQHVRYMTANDTDTHTHTEREYSKKWKKIASKANRSTKGKLKLTIIARYFVLLTHLLLLLCLGVAVRCRWHLPLHKAKNSTFYSLSVWVDFIAWLILISSPACFPFDGCCANL